MGPRGPSGASHTLGLTRDSTSHHLSISLSLAFTSPHFTPASSFSFLVSFETRSYESPSVAVITPTNTNTMSKSN